MRDGCPFCDYEGPSLVYEAWGDGSGSRPPFWQGEVWESWDGIMAYVIEPINPVVEGHRLVVPVEHVVDFRDDPDVTAELFACAASFARGLGDCNLIVSGGVAATQTVPHVHVHVLPRREGDGLLLPWSAPDVVEGFGAAIDLIDTYLSWPDEKMNPIRAAYRQVAPRG